MGEYITETGLLPRDPLAAAMGETALPVQTFLGAQPAVDAARTFVRDFAGPGLPRARVYHIRRWQCTPMIFRCWRTPGGEYREERCEAVA